jgi:hypothetical protein
MGNCSNQWRTNGSLPDAYRLELEGQSVRKTLADMEDEMPQT